MKRLLVVIFCLLLIGGGGAAWWYLRDTPEKVLRDGLLNLANAKGITQVQFDVALTDLQSGKTTGFTSVSQMNLSDLTRPQSQGILRVGAQSSTDADQLIDLVVQKTWIHIRPRIVNADRRAQVAQLLGGASSTAFLSVDRDSFLQKFGYAEAIANGASSSVHDALSFVLPAIVPSGQIEKTSANGTASATVHFRFDRTALRPVLITILRAWKKGNPNVDEYTVIDRMTEELGRGTFSVTIDGSSRRPVQITGEWPLITEQGVEITRVRLQVDLMGVGSVVNIATPAMTKDVTQQTVRDDRLAPLPGAGSRTVLPGESVTTTQSGTPATKTQIDLFQQYSEQLQRKKNLF